MTSTIVPSHMANCNGLCHPILRLLNALRIQQRLRRLEKDLRLVNEIEQSLELIIEALLEYDLALSSLRVRSQNLPDGYQQSQDSIHERLDQLDRDLTTEAKTDGNGVSLLPQLQLAIREHYLTWQNLSTSQTSEDNCSQVARPYQDPPQNQPALESLQYEIGCETFEYFQLRQLLEAACFMATDSSLWIFRRFIELRQAVQGQSVLYKEECILKESDIAHQGLAGVKTYPTPAEFVMNYLVKYCPSFSSVLSQVISECKDDSGRTFFLDLALIAPISEKAISEEEFLLKMSDARYLPEQIFIKKVVGIKNKVG